MNTNHRYQNGTFLTRGEKTLAVMLVAGLIGYWAGFNLAATDVAITIPHASAAAAPTAAPVLAPVATPDLPSRAHAAAPATEVARDDPPVATF
jgi:hypothetical protein